MQQDIYPLCRVVMHLLKSLHRLLYDVFIKLKKHQFLFEELVKRDFKKKYKRTLLGMGWSVLSPLLTLLVMNMVFSHFFGRRVHHYTIYLFCGTLVFGYYSESTKGGMGALLENSGIFTKVNVPKYLFLLSKNVSATINFALSLCVFFLFVFFDNIAFSARFFFLLYPIACLLVFNIGAGLVLSALYVFFRDIKYLYDVFVRLVMYMSAIFYTVDSFSPAKQRLFLCNPVYCYIKYFRIIVVDGGVPSLAYHLLCAFYALAAFAVGGWCYKRYNHKFLYYV